MLKDEIKDIALKIEHKAKIWGKYAKAFYIKWSNLDTWKEVFIPENPAEHPRLVRFLGLTFVLVFLVIGITFLLSFFVVQAKIPRVRIPSVVNKDITEAIRLLQSENLKARFEMIFDENYDKYEIIRQKPSPGSSVREGREIYLIVSLGKDQYIVPELSDIPKDAALTLLDDKKIPYIIRVVPAGDQPLNKIIAMNHPAGSEISRDTPLILTITDEIMENQYRMDNYTRHPLEFAANTLLNNRITPIVITTNVASLSDDGLILEQNVAVGSILIKNSSAILTVGSYAYDEGERENMRWHVFSYRIPRVEGTKQIISTNEIGEVVDLGEGEQRTAKFYQAIVEDELGRTRTIYERMGAEGTSFIRVFKSYGKTKVYIYADNEIIGSRDYGN